MKVRKWCLILIIIMLVAEINVPVLAASSENTDTEIVLLENGDYFEIKLEESVSRSGTRTGTKTSTYKNSDGEALWYVSVTGTFSYTGSSCKCTSSSVNVGTYSDDWKISSKSSSYSSNTAMAEAVAKKYFLGIAVSTISETVTLTCSNTGVLS